MDLRFARMPQLVAFLVRYRLDHIVAAAFVYVPVLLLVGVALGTTCAALSAWLCVTMYYLGRERRDHEREAQLNPHYDWANGWLLWRWSRDGKLDFILPVVFWGSVSAMLVGVSPAP